MKGVIVYSEDSLKINGFFADKLKTELINLGVKVDIVLQNQNFDADFAVMRVYNPSLSEELYVRGIRTFNNKDVSLICNDKWQTYLFLKQNGIPVAPTQTVESCDLAFPRIVKARHGHGGSEVFWTNSEAEFSAVVSSLKDSAIVQPPVGKRGRDLRVYVLGGKPIVAMLRKSDIDFRSNFSLGGTAERYNLNEQEEDLVCRIAKLLKADFVGIDFLLTDSGLICNEIEDVVGCRMVYTYTDVDIIKKYAEHIVCSTLCR